MRGLIIILLAIATLIGCSKEGDSSFSQSASTSGVASSLAKFTISGNTLYYADFTALMIYDITDASSPRLVNQVETTIGIETIFPYENYLFLGGTFGVEIYDITSPQRPTYTSTFVHAQGCDPVIVRNDIAYVTLRQSAACNATVPASILNVLDISDVTRPMLMAEIQMENPYGLTFYKDNLYVSEGDLGMKKFDLTYPYHPELDTFYRDISTYDLLGLDDVLLVTGNDGLYSFDVEGDELIELAKIQR